MWSLVFLACSSSSVEPQRTHDAPLRRHPVEIEGAVGLSGLARLDDHLVAVTERPPQVVWLQPTGDQLQATRVLPIRGLDAGLEPESVGVRSDGSLWIGTEAVLPGRKGDVLARLELRGDHYQVVQREMWPWALWGLKGGSNQGLEGLCVAGQRLVVAGEPVSSDEKGRWAPVGVYANGQWKAYRLRLTSEAGKISSLDCTDAPNPQVWAIERHYPVMRVISATLADDAELVAKEHSVPPGTYDPSINWEGLAWLGEELWLLSDNQSSRVTGPTQAQVLVPGD